MLIIGSLALGKEDYNDIDMIGTPLEIQEWFNLNISNISHIKTFNSHNAYYLKADSKWVEIEIAWPNSSGEKYLKLMNAEGIIKDIPMATSEILFSIKKSHINFPIKFPKHISSYHMLKNLVGDDSLTEITKIRFNETEKRVGKLKTPSLNKSVKKFFKQSNGFVKQYFIHDDIHNCVAHLNRPIYEYMQSDKDVAICNKELWDNFPTEWRNWAVEEEATVIALERLILPNLFDGGKYISPDEAFKWALMRISTNLCSGFFRQWAVDNYFSILETYNKNYVENFLAKIDEGKINFIEEEKQIEII